VVISNNVGCTAVYLQCVYFTKPAFLLWNAKFASCGISRRFDFSKLYAKFAPRIGDFWAM